MFIRKRDYKTGAAHPLSLRYIVTRPDGSKEEIVGVWAFAKANNLSPSALAAAAAGKVDEVKGYKIRYADRAKAKAAAELRKQRKTAAKAATPGKPALTGEQLQAVLTSYDGGRGLMHGFWSRWGASLGVAPSTVRRSVQRALNGAKGGRKP